MSFCRGVKFEGAGGDLDPSAKLVRLIGDAGDFALDKLGIDAAWSTGFAESFFPLSFFGPLIIEVDGLLSFRLRPHSAIPLPFPPWLDPSPFSSASLPDLLRFLGALGLSTPSSLSLSLFMSFSKFISADWTLSAS